MKRKQVSVSSSVSDLLVSVNQLEKGVAESRVNANNITKMIQMCVDQTGNYKVLVAVTSALRRCFIKLSTEEDFSVIQAKNQSADMDVQKYRQWLYEKYEQFIVLLLDLLNSEPRNQVIAIHSLLDLVSHDCKSRALNSENSDNLAFYTDLFYRVIAHTFSCENFSENLTIEFNAFMKYDDLRLYTFKALKHFFDQSKLLPENSSDFFSRNVFAFLCTIKYDLTGEYFANADRTDLHRGAASSSAEQNNFQGLCWIALLKNKLPKDLYKTVLLQIPSVILPCLAKASHFEKGKVNVSPTSPLLLADFLSDSFNYGGVLSLLSLNGLFLLMQEYNLQYPEFYPKLYALLSPHIFHAKYRMRFFRLLDLFLSSSYVSATMIGAFSKKLCSLALTAPPSGCTYILTLVFNLLKRHPSLAPMIHRPRNIEQASKQLSLELAGLSSEASSQGKDPFDKFEKDVNACKALESSLWEIKTLSNHYIWSVSKQAKVFSAENAPKAEFSVEDSAQHTYSSLMQEEIAKKSEVPPALAIAKSKFFDESSFSAWKI